MVSGSDSTASMAAMRPLIAAGPIERAFIPASRAGSMVVPPAPGGGGPAEGAAMPAPAATVATVVRPVRQATRQARDKGRRMLPPRGSGLQAMVSLMPLAWAAGVHCLCNDVRRAGFREYDLRCNSPAADGVLETGTRRRG